MTFQFQEDAEYEFNAQFDDVRERFASTVLDAYQEGYCDYLNQCEQSGDDPVDFDAWRASLRAPGTAPDGWGGLGGDEIPF